MRPRGAHGVYRDLKIFDGGEAEFLLVRLALPDRFGISNGDPFSTVRWSGRAME